MSTVASLPRRLRDPVTKEFRGERVLWVARPSPAQSFLIGSLVWLFAVPWTAFSIFWEVMALQGWLSGKPAPSGLIGWAGLAFPLFGIPFVLIGLGMMATPFLAWIWARRTVHVVTDRRLATMTVGRRLKVKSHDRASIVRTERTEHHDGSGTLKIVTGVERDGDGDKVEDAEVLYGIRDVRKVERLIAPFVGNNRHAA